MGLVDLSESTTTSSKQNDGKSAITTAEIATSVKDTFTNRTALSMDTYPEALQSVLSAADGIRTIVEYYHKAIPYVNNQLGATGFALEKAAIHSSYDKIVKFEILLTDELSIEIDSETGEASAEGEAYIYPGIQPNSGDLFYLRLLDDQIGVFIVDSVDRLAISRSTYHKISFHLYSYLDEHIRDKIKTSVRETLHFNKEKYFNDTITLLTDSSHNALTTLLKFRDKLYSYYISRHYRKDVQTFVDTENGRYDPCLIEFLIRKIPNSRINIFQLLPGIDNRYEETIWHALIKRDLTSLTCINHVESYVKFFAWDAYLTLANKFTIPVVRERLSDIQSKRLIPVTSNTYDVYHFSKWMYFTLLHHFNMNAPISDVVPLLGTMNRSPVYFGQDLESVYSVAHNAYLTTDQLTSHDTLTGSNNDIHLSEIEYMIVDCIVNDNVDQAYFMNTIVPAFPFSNMNNRDRYVILPVLMHLSDMLIKRVR